MIYLRYFVYLIEHKWNVFIECLKMGLLIHAFTHDLSKFLLEEFVPYAKYYCSNRKNTTSDYELAWHFHRSRNRHHWDYWVDINEKALPMPKKYVKQMICDWRGMARKFQDTAEEFFEKNRRKMILHESTVVIIENLLNNRG